MDPRLDRRVEFDERSRAFPVRALISTEKKPRGYTWKVDTFLDQGQEGACTGFAWAHELAAKPVRVPDVTNDLARSIYNRARQLDEWPGEDYEGSSVLAAAKAVQELGHLTEYRWAFGVDDLMMAVAYRGPAVLGINWYSGMFSPDSDGFLNVTGNIEGGHAILCHSYSHTRREFKVWNSWGHGWGYGSTAKIRYDDMARLLSEQGEACIPTMRGKP